MNSIRKYHWMIALPVLSVILPWSFSLLLAFAAARAQWDLNWLPDSMDANETWPFEERIQRDEFVLKWASRGSLISAHMAHLALGFACIYYIFGYYKSSALYAYLKSRGYDSVTLRDAAMIYSSVRNRAFSLPDAATVLVIPGYGSHPDQIVRYIRDQFRYKALK